MKNLRKYVEENVINNKSFLDNSRSTQKLEEDLKEKLYIHKNRQETTKIDGEEFFAKQETKFGMKTYKLF